VPEFKNISRIFIGLFLNARRSREPFEINLKRQYPHLETICEIASGKSVLEFGAGHSTSKLAEVATMLVSVESDPRAMKIVRDSIGKGSQVLLKYAFVGPVGAFGVPKKNLKPLFKYFYHIYYEYPFKRHSSYEVVFVDGRFRVACMIQTCLRMTHSFTLICDDFFNRPEYHVVLKLFGKPGVLSENAAIWTIIPTLIDREKAEKILREYRFESE
jgi:hypothetical protein